ncbi:hypothetical protein [Nocardia wallacei]|uniref:hypothetical protein n=1 Tax=Nocardia wallacei TaxID=480035 RepID=UPI0024580DAF|nr:hypothetical protein [Nocardia wallacei]
MVGGWALWVSSYWHASHLSAHDAQRDPGRWERYTPELRSAVTALVAAAIEQAAVDSGVGQCLAPVHLADVQIGEVGRSLPRLPAALLAGGLYWPGPSNPGAGAWPYVEHALSSPDLAERRDLLAGVEAVLDTAATLPGPQAVAVTLGDLLPLWSQNNEQPANDPKCSLRHYADTAATPQDQWVPDA